jgi:2-polyprenyl-3-methyl-5-hydroxy-6-metoxy-1,4-benzoquinol methylase
MAICFLCGAAMVHRFTVRDHLRPAVRTKYKVEWCKDCDFGAVAGSFSPSEVSAFYTPDYYTHVTQGSSGQEAMRLADRLRVNLAWRRDDGVNLSPAEVAQVRSQPVLCDVGCGGGQAMEAFKQAGYDVMGIEPDGAARALAKTVGQVFEGTAEALPDAVEGRAFDVVLLSHVLEHCIDPAKALGNVKRLLGASGTAVIEVPNNAAWGAEMFGAGWFFADVPRHLQFFSEASLTAALAQAGLRVTRVFYTGYTRQFSPAWLAAQAEIGKRVGLNGGAPGGPSALKLLARTAFAGAARKYDSIRVHAVHAG